jgi:hypothetical protein
VQFLYYFTSFYFIYGFRLHIYFVLWYPQFTCLPLLINKWPREWLQVLRYIQTWVVIGRILQLSNIWSGCKCSTTKCILVVIVKLRDIIMIYFYQIWHLIFCWDNFSNSYCNDELLYMKGGILQDPMEPLHTTLHVPHYLLSYTYSENKRVICCYHATAWIW